MPELRTYFKTLNEAYNAESATRTITVDKENLVFDIATGKKVQITVAGTGVFEVASLVATAALDIGAWGFSCDGLDAGAAGITNAGAMSGATTIDGNGDLTMGTITMPGFTVDADGDMTCKSLTGSEIGDMNIESTTGDVHIIPAAASIITLGDGGTTNYISISNAGLVQEVGGAYFDHQSKVHFEDIGNALPLMKLIGTVNAPTAAWGIAETYMVSTDVAGWVEIDIGGALRYIPYWA